MRYWRIAAATIVLVVALTGCAREIAGVAQRDSSAAGVTITDDEFGILVGRPDAPAQIELFTEPQCDHCAQLQADYGEAIKKHIESGDLAVTYRPLTFLDDQFDDDYSAVVANALFLAVDPATSATTFQEFVEELWASQDLSFSEYADSDFADIAKKSGLAQNIVDNIGAGTSAVDTDGMSVFNGQALLVAVSGSIRTPVVFDANSDSEVDIDDADWLDKLTKKTK